MRTLILSLCISLPLLAPPQDLSLPQGLDAPQSEATKPKLDFSALSAAERQAIASVVAADKGSPDGKSKLPHLSASPEMERFARKFDEAKIPGCFRPDGLKYQPTLPLYGWQPALVFIAIAALRGKCN